MPQKPPNKPAQPSQEPPRPVGPSPLPNTPEELLLNGRWVDLLPPEEREKQER